MPDSFYCCEHCEHGINDAPHDTPCPAGCNAYELEAFDDDDD